MRCASSIKIRQSYPWKRNTTQVSKLVFRKNIWRSWAVVMCGFLGVVGADCAPVTNQQKDHVNAASPMQSFYEPLSDAQNHSPIRLLGEDGTPLKLNSLIIRGQINEPLAVTELELEFVNPERRSFNANFEMDLPSGAQVQRFAVFRDQQWEFAEVVSRDESEGHGTHLSGPSQRRNHQLFAAQLSEISASQTTRLSITYSQEIRNHSHPYQIFLAGLPKLARIDIQLHGQDLQVKTGDGYVQRISEKQAVFRLAETNYQPQRNLRIELPKVSGIAVHHENMLVTRISPVDHDHQAPIASIAILFDTSASQGYHFATQLQRLKDLIAALKEQAGQQVQLQVLCFDQEIQPIFAGSIGDFGHDQVKAIQRRKALGASDLAGALRYISARQGQANQRWTPQRLVLLTDAVNTTELGGTSSLQEEFLRLKQAGVKRLDLVINGHLQTASVMDQLATANFPEPGLLISADTPAKQLAIKLLRTVVAGVNVEIPGSDWIYPQTLQSVQSDDEVFVYAGMPSQIFSRQAHDIQLKLSGAIRGTQIIPVQQVSSSLVEKLWAHAFVDYLYQQQQECTVGDLCNMWKERAIRASVDHGVLNEFTALSLNTRETSMRQAVLSVVPEYRSWRIHTASTPSLSLAQKMPSPILENALAKRWKESRQKSNEITTKFAEKSMISSYPSHALSELKIAERPVQHHSVSTVSMQIGPERKPEQAYSGMLLSVMNQLRWGNKTSALHVAKNWYEAEPEHVLSLIGLGEALEANEQFETAARVYGSIIDLFPNRAGMRRLAAGRLEHLGSAFQWLVVDSYRQALELRPEDPSSFRLFAFALLRDQFYQEAFAVLMQGLERVRQRKDKSGFEAVLLADIGLVAAAWMRQEPAQREKILEKLSEQNIELPTKPSLRFILTWETEASDVDLHIRDGEGWHAYYKNPELASGGRLYADVHEGYGFEVFAIDESPTAYPYNVQVEYYNVGATEYGMGKVEIMEHDGSGRLAFVQKPFVVTKDRAFIDLGNIEASLL